MRGWTPTLQATLLALIVGLLAATALSILAAATYAWQRNFDEYTERLISLSGLTIGLQVTSLLTPADPVLEQAVADTVFGRLSVDDVDDLSAYLVDRLRHQRHTAWFSYGDHDTGRFVGAWRREDGAIMLNRSQPGVDGGRTFEFEVRPDGRLAPFQREEVTGYDPRVRPWYREAATNYRAVWVGPYRFNRGEPGITAALAVRRSGTPEPRGVFTVDFLLDDLSAFLAQLTAGRAGATVRYAVLTRSGEAVATSWGGSENGADLVLDAALEAAPRELSSLDIERLVRYTFTSDDVTYIGGIQAFRAATGLEWVSAVIVPYDDFLAVVQQNRRTAITVALLVLGVAAVLGSLLAQRVANPLRLIARDLQEVGSFKLTAQPSPKSFVRELAVVSDSVDRMKASLRSFGHYVPTQLVHDVLASGEEARLGGTKRLLTLYFSDIAGFTSVSESMDPERLVTHLGEYLEAMTTVIQDQHGTVDKFIGDGILALFNAPRELADHAAAGCRAALRSQACLQELAVCWEAAGLPIFRARIGLHTGEAIVGNFGTPDRFDYTVMGDSVNLASRLEGVNKAYGTWILGSQELRDATGAEFEWRTLDRVAVVGRSGGTVISELLGERGQVAGPLTSARDVYESALSAYLSRDFRAARAGFRAAAEARPGDLAAEIMAARAAELIAQPPPADWDGVYRHLAK